MNKEAQIQELLEFIREMIMNYASLLALNPDVFPTVLPEFPNEEGLSITAHRLVDTFQSFGYPSSFMQEFNKALENMDAESFEAIYATIFHLIRMKYVTTITIFDGSSTLIDILTSIVSYNDRMKELFLCYKSPTGAVWIPGPSGINLEKGIGSCTGDNLEFSSILGPLFQPSFLPTTLNLKPTESIEKVYEKMMSELNSSKT